MAPRQVTAVLLLDGVCDILRQVNGLRRARWVRKVLIPLSGFPWLASCCLPHDGERTVDLNLNMLKARVAEAFVEDILVQAGYWVARGGRESQLQRLLKNGSDNMPDFLACKSHLTPRPPRHRLFAVEVKYRRDIARYLAQDGREDCTRLAAQQWPEAYMILATDNPDPGRACFQAIDLDGYAPDRAPSPVDLHDVPDLGIWKALVVEYEGLLKRMFVAIREERELRKPAVKVLSRAG